jgi:hypothetical protein
MKVTSDVLMGQVMAVALYLVVGTERSLILSLVKLKKKCHSGRKSQKVTRFVERVAALNH